MLIDSGLDFAHLDLAGNVSRDGDAELPQKNKAAWYLGLPGSTIAYRGSGFSATGEIVFLLGKLDKNRQLEGVDGERILLGTVPLIEGPITPSPYRATLPSGKVMVNRMLIS